MSKPKKKQRKTPQRHIPYVPIALCGIFALSMILRAALSYNNVFIGGENVVFQGNDPWYHMRLAENMLYNFPKPMFYDYYTWFPAGSPIIIPPMMSWLIVAGGYIVALGTPTIHALQVSGAWLPPVLGSLVLIPVYFIGKAMHSKWTGVLAAAIVAVLPTGFLFRSMLGFTDHHVLEVLLTVTAMMFLVMAYKHSKLRYYIFAGVALGFLHLAWQGAIFILFILWFWFVVQFLLDYWGGGDTTRVWHGAIVTFGVSCAIHLPWVMQSSLPVAYRVIPIVAIAILPLVALLASHINSKRTFAIVIGSLTGIILLTIQIVSPTTLELFVYAFSIAKVRTISETLPLLPTAAFKQYGLNLILFFGGLFVAIKSKQRPLLIVIWSLIMFIAVSTQCRWDYYFPIAIGLMSAYFFTTAGVHFIKEVRQGISLVLCIVMLFLTVPTSISISRQSTLINRDWYIALNVLRENSPEPFTTTDAYYQLELEEKPSYGVLSWWDYGHWITYIAHRVPTANPFQQGAVEAAEFFVDGKEIEGVKYIIVDEAMLTYKYYAMVAWLDRDASGIRSAPADSAIARLVNGELPGYKLVHRENTVWIFEKG